MGKVKQSLFIIFNREIQPSPCMTLLHFCCELRLTKFNYYNISGYIS